MPSLYVEMGAGADRSGEVIKIGGTRVLAGSSHRCEIVLHSDIVSREHATIRLTGEGWILEDLGGGQGTIVNGKRVGRTLLQPLDTVRFGSAGPMVRIISMDPAPDAAKVVDDPKTEQALLAEPTSGGTVKTFLRSLLFFLAGAGLGTLLSMQVFGSRFPYLETTAPTTWILRQLAALDLAFLEKNMRWVHGGLTALWYGVIFIALARPNKRWPLLVLMLAAHAGGYFLVLVS